MPNPIDQLNMAQAAMQQQQGPPMQQGQPTMPPGGQQPIPGAAPQQPQMMPGQMMPGQGPMPGQHQASPLDVLLMFATSTEDQKKEVSLKTLKKAEIEKIMQAFIRCRNDANAYYTSTIEPKIIEREQAYQAKEDYYRRLFPHLSETSSFCSRDIQTAVKWMLPSLCEPFIGGENPVDVKGVNANDDPAAEKIQQLLTYELQRKNSYPLFIADIMEKALSINYGVAKVYWKREEDRETYQILVGADDYQIMAVLNEEAEAGHVEIQSIKPLKDAPDLSIVTFDKIIVKSNYPVVQYMSPSELRFTPDSTNLQDAKFKAQRKLVTGDYLKRKEREGVYENIDEALEKADGDAKYTTYDLLKNKELSSTGGRINDGDNASKLFELYEGYLSVDFNGDGIYEHLIVHAIGDTPIRISTNEMEFAPFFIAEAEPSPNTVFNEDEGFSDLLEQHQNLKTAIFRQIITNVAKNNSPRTFVDMSKVDMDALIDNDEIIPTNGSPADAIMPGQQLSISPLSMQVIEYAQNEIESQSGSTRYNQGLDSNSLNKTATGITSIMGAADKRMRHIARVFAESFVVPMFKYIILLNQKYMDDEQIFRLTDQNISITKDDLNIDYDLIINVGQGAGTREAQIQYLMVMINQLFPQLQQMGVVTENSWYEAAKKLLESMGIRNINAYLLDPDSPEAQQRKAEAQQAQAQAQQQALAVEQAKEQFELAKASTPKLSVSYEDIPPEAKIQALKKYLNIDVNSSDVMQEERLDDARYISRWGKKNPFDAGGGLDETKQPAATGQRVQRQNQGS